jgi:hypothetical protein
MRQFKTLIRLSLLIITLLQLSMALPTRAADQAPPDKAAYPATFNFDAFTGGKGFNLNTLPTTPYGPAWADILVHPARNFLSCKGAAIALCYYSGPAGTVTPCTKDKNGLANCTCYVIPAGETYQVDINAILNKDVYLETVKQCGPDGSLCGKNSSKPIAACDAVNNNTMVPGADYISTFSPYLQKHHPKQFPIKAYSCEATPGQYAGCMTAPCKKFSPAKTDPNTGLELVQCACPILEKGGPFQIGNATNPPTCDLGGDSIWSAAYTVPQQKPTKPKKGSASASASANISTNASSAN